MQISNVILLALAALLTACGAATPRRVTSLADVNHGEVRFDRPDRAGSHG